MDLKNNLQNAFLVSEDYLDDLVVTKKTITKHELLTENTCYIGKKSA